jgi:aminoacyl tRNA synthase complex-interacting multifunctional protein 1
MRVGLIRTATKHPDADSLYVEEVDVGEEKPRTVISGLVKHIPIEEMQNRRAILMCNLKPSKMRGIMSEAMVMCASTPDKVEILTPPEDANLGDPVLVEGYERMPDAQLNPKKKIFEACAPDLKCNGDKIATYKGVPWTVNGKHVKSQSLTDVQVR